MGATVALPFLDAMVPARTALAKTAAPGRRVSSASRWCTAPPAARDRAARRTSGRRRRSGSDVRPDAEQPGAARAVPRLPDDRQQHRRARAPRRSSTPEIGGDHFRSSAVFLTQTHPKQTEGLGRLRRRRRSTRCTRRGSGRTRRSRRCSCASRTSTRRAAAPTATRASTPTRSAGRRRTSRCR